MPARSPSREAGPHRDGGDVDQVLGIGPEDVDAEQPSGGLVKDRLDQSLGLSADARGARVREGCPSDRDAATALPRRRLGEADLGKCGDRERGRGEHGEVDGPPVAPQRVLGGELPLVPRGRRVLMTARRVARRVDVRGAGRLAEFVDAHRVTLELDPGRLEPEVRGVGAPARGHEDRVRREPFATPADLRLDRQTRGDSRNTGAGSDVEPRFTRQREECVPNLPVCRRDHVVTRLEHGHAGPGPAEREAELHADRSAADHDEPAGERRLLEELIARQPALDALDRRPHGGGAGGEDDPLRRDAAPVYRDLVRGREAGTPAEHGDALLLERLGLSL